MTTVDPRAAVVAGETTRPRLLTLVDLVATAVFAIGGARAGVAAGLDVFGLMVVAFALPQIDWRNIDLGTWRHPPAQLWQAFGRLNLDIDEPIARSGCVIASWHASGVGKRSGIPVDMDGYCVFCMHRHKVSRVEFFESEQAALSAARRIGRQMHASASGSVTMGAGGFEPPTSRV